MVILPAIDLKDGKCVRLRQGRADDVTVYGDDPAAQARDWREQGGEELHVVDLDGAFAGTPKHAETIARIIEAFGGPVEVGGGLRDAESLRAVIEAGAARAIIGSAALEDPAFLSEAVELYGDKIAVVGTDPVVKNAASRAGEAPIYFTNPAGKLSRTYEVLNDSQEIFAVASYQFTAASQANIKFGAYVVTDGNGMWVAQAAAPGNTYGFIGKVHSLVPDTYSRSAHPLRSLTREKSR